MKKVLIIGAGGFIGQNLYGQIKRSTEVEVVGSTSKYTKEAKNKSLVVLDLTDTTSISKIISISPDIIINCAGPSSVQLSEQNGFEDFKKSPVLVLNLCESCRQLAIYKPVKLIHLSSSAVYGDFIGANLKSTNEPRSIYGKNKLITERIIETYSKSYNFESYTLRIFSAYGPRLFKQLIYDILERARNENPTVLFGTGQEIRDFIYIDDIVKCIIQLLFENNKEPIIDVGTGVPTSIEEVRLTLCSLLPTRMSDIVSNLEFNNRMTKNSPKYLCAPMPRNQLQIGKHTSLKEGLQKTIDWYLLYHKYTLNQ